MRKLVVCFGMLCLTAFAQTTPNIGLNIPAFGTQNWNVLLNSNFSKLDLLLSGNQTLTNLSLTGNLTINGQIIGNNNTISTSSVTGIAIVSLGGGVGHAAIGLADASHGGASISDNTGNSLILGSNASIVANIHLTNVNGTSGLVNTSSATTYVYGSPLQVGVNPTPSGVSNVSVGFNITSSNITAVGELITAASTAGSAGFNLPHGVSPTAPVNGDVWTTTAGLFAQINGSTVGPFSTSSGTGLSGMTAGQVPIAATATTVISSKAIAGSGAAITSGPNTSTSNDLACFTGTLGQLADCAIAKGNVVLASSPGVGIAHFAGATQTVTSSAVDLSGADITGNITASHFNSGTGASTSTFLRGDMTWQTVTTSSAWSALTNPATSLSLTMGANTSTFNTTSALSQFFAWKNTTAAVVGTSQGSPVLAGCGRAFHASADVEDCWTISELPGNGNDAGITINIGHTGTSTGLVTLQAPGPVAAGSGSGGGGGFDFPEGTVVSANTGHDICYADSTLHGIKCSYNNGAFIPLNLVTPLTAGSSITLAAPSGFAVCTTTCTVTVPVPAAGYQFCVYNDDNVSTVITLAAIGSSARYENTARTAYGTAGTGTFVSGGAVKDMVCIVGRDSTHYSTTNFIGTWTAN